MPETPTYGLYKTPFKSGYCQKFVYLGSDLHQCPHKAKKDGWCKQHHPDTVAAKHAKWEADHKARMEGYNREARDRRIAAACVEYVQRLAEAGDAEAKRILNEGSETNA